ncbi:MAG: oligosaccharide flippase family protein [Flavobacteriales bacterium]|nr:oligosaccharide flippase family protein [Flavobacteriales bacterium]
MKQHWSGMWERLLAVRHRGAFTQDVTYMMGGKAITMVVGLVLTPILSRIYAQETFGTFGLLNSMAIIGASVAGLRLSDAFILPRSERGFTSLVRVTAWSCVVLFLLFTACLLIFQRPLFSMLNMDLPWTTALLIPLFILLYAAEDIQVNWVRRLKAFRQVSMVDPLGQFSSRVFAIGMGLAMPSHWWLFLKEAVRVLVNTILRWRWILSPHVTWSHFKPPRRREVRTVLRRYWRLPVFRVPTALVGTFTNALPAYMVAAFYDATAVGDLTMAATLLTFPLFLFANTMDSVFQQKAAELRDRGTVELMRGTLQLYTLLLLLGSLVFGVVYWYGDQLFSVFLGGQWERSGRLAMALAPWYLSRMINAPVVGLRLVLDKQHWDLAYTVLSGLFIAGCLAVTNPLGRGLEFDIFWMSMVNALLMLISSIASLTSAGIRPVVALLVTVAMVGLGALLTGLPALFW